jgi:uncharacterized membrane protein
MNATHFHLIITHLPIYGAIIGAAVLGFGLLTRSRDTCNAAYMVLLISAIGGVMAYLTGEPAEETVENIAGISKNMIEEHEESANLTLILVIITGLSSCIGLFLSLRSSKFIRSLATAILIISIVCFAATAYTGYLGGKIRHTELENPSKHTFEQKP